MTRLIVFFGFFLCIAVFIYIGAPWIYGKWLRVMLRLKASKFKTLVLTFDDGPGSRLTPVILETLAKKNAKATFFLLGRNITGREQIVRQIAQQGHEICSHGYNHLHHWKVSPMRIIKDIKQGWDAIDAALGSRRGKYPFRPPNGKLNIISLFYLLFCRVPIVYWSLDLGDTWTIKPDPQTITLQIENTDGFVSLAHDFDRSDESADPFVLEYVKTALAIAQKNKLRITPALELLNAKS
jgi:peptidoglycan/xylan/chitin deacetylase (PgdA/CDA1 family)